MFTNSFSRLETCNFGRDSVIRDWTRNRAGVDRMSTVWYHYLQAAVKRLARRGRFWRDCFGLSCTNGVEFVPGNRYLFHDFVLIAALLLQL